MVGLLALIFRTGRVGIGAEGALACGALEGLEGRTEDGNGSETDGGGIIGIIGYPIGGTEIEGNPNGKPDNPGKLGNPVIPENGIIGGIPGRDAPGSGIPIGLIGGNPIDPGAIGPVAEGIKGKLNEMGIQGTGLTPPLPRLLYLGSFAPYLFGTWNLIFTLSKVARALTSFFSSSSFLLFFPFLRSDLTIELSEGNLFPL